MAIFLLNGYLFYSNTFVVANFYVLIYLVLLLITFGLFFKLHLKSANLDFKILKNTLNQHSNLQYRYYFLYLGIIFPIAEAFNLILNKSNIINSYVEFSIGAFCIIVFFLTQKKEITNYSYYIFRTCFFILLTSTLYSYLIEKPSLIMFSKYLLLMFFAFVLFKKFTSYLIFIGINFLILFGLTIFKNEEISNIIILINSLFVILIVHFGQIIRHVKSNERLIFTQDIINNTNSIIIATDNFGNLQYCNDSITKILGYTPEEVLGKAFWKLTEDPDYEDGDYTDKFKPNSVYTRKLKCKNGDYKFIQWTDFKYTSNIYVATGQDITSRINLENKYSNLIQNAKDIIYESDKYGTITYVNKFALTVSGYTQDEILGKNFSYFVKDDYKLDVVNFYIQNIDENDEYDLFHFFIIKIYMDLLNCIRFQSKD
mgnify:CR=1 FL=1